MSGPRLFLDSSAVVAGAASEAGAARALLMLGEAGRISVIVSEQVIVETERTLARKLPEGLPAFRQMLLSAGLVIVRTPDPEDIAPYLSWIIHSSDLPILVAAMHASVDFLVTFNRRHFLDDPNLAVRSGLQIGLPGDALAWLRTMWVAE